MGVALLKDGQLMDWKVQSFSGEWSGKKLEIVIRYIDTYIDRNKVTAIAIKIPDELPVSANYIQLVGTLNALFERKGIMPVYYTLSDLKKHHCPKEKVNKARLAACVAARYPELIPEYQKESNNRNSYYSKVFEAIATARMYWELTCSLPT